MGSFIFCRSDLLPEVYTRCDNAAFANFVAAISRTNSNWCEFVRLIAATKFCRSDYDFHEINRVTQGDLLRRLVPATRATVPTIVIAHTFCASRRFVTRPRPTPRASNMASDTCFEQANFVVSQDLSSVTNSTLFVRQVFCIFFF